VSGAVFAFLYHYPDAFPRPATSATDEEKLRLAACNASAPARRARNLRWPPRPTRPGGAGRRRARCAAPVGAPLFPRSSAVRAGCRGTEPRGGGGGGCPPSRCQPTAEEPLFCSPPECSPLPGEFRDGYRYVCCRRAVIGTMIFVLKRALVRLNLEGDP